MSTHYTKVKYETSLPFPFNHSESRENCKWGYVFIIFFKVIGARVEVKYRPSLLHSAEERNIRTQSLGIQNYDEAIIKLTFKAFVDIIVNIYI